ncbi:Uncharacterised protein [Budvicia aquatica]|uniref:Uncharacterized protein n=1 Tax=Budvicia aquatica TaxID=82979 RepID=A0A484ZTR6_9GAMM|nr:Uncharacterised protein [Budvicia aquatica]
MANQSRLKKDIETLRHISEPCNGGVTELGLLLHTDRVWNILSNRCRKSG